MRFARPGPPLSDPDLRLLRVFKAVVDNGGFAASEVALNKSKSAISVDIGNLEQRFGVRLCERGRSGFALTVQGEAVYQAVAALFEDLDRFSGQIAVAAGRLSGRVTLGVIDNIGSIAATPMIAAIRAFRQRHPDVQLNIQSGSASEVERGVLDGTADVGVSVLLRLAPELDVIPLFVEHQRLYCGQAHPLFDLDASELSPDRIAEHPIVSLPTRDPATSPFLGNLVRGAQADNLDCLILVVLAGVDLGFMPPHYARRWVEAGDLRALRPDLYRLTSTFHLVSLKRGKLAPARRALIETLALAFEDHPVCDEAMVA
jgi:DNA-binding transcriptional LysR family regulator